MTMWERNAHGTSAEGGLELRSGQLERPGEPDARPFVGRAEQIYLSTLNGCLALTPSATTVILLERLSFGIVAEIALHGAEGSMAGIAVRDSDLRLTDVQGLEMRRAEGLLAVDGLQDMASAAVDGEVVLVANTVGASSASGLGALWWSAVVVVILAAAVVYVRPVLHFGQAMALGAYMGATPVESHRQRWARGCWSLARTAAIQKQYRVASFYAWLAELLSRNADHVLLRTVILTELGCKDSNHRLMGKALDAHGRLHRLLSRPDERAGTLVEAAILATLLKREEDAVQMLQEADEEFADAVDQGIHSKDFDGLASHPWVVARRSRRAGDPGFI